MKVQKSQEQPFIIVECCLVLTICVLQPPKKKGGKKGKKGKKSAKTKTPTIIDGVSAEEMTKEQAST